MLKQRHFTKKYPYALKALNYVWQSINGRKNEFFLENPIHIYCCENVPKNNAVYAVAQFDTQKMFDFKSRSVPFAQTASEIVENACENRRKLPIAGISLDISAQI